MKYTKIKVEIEEGWTMDEQCDIGRGYEAGVFVSIGETRYGTTYTVEPDHVVYACDEQPGEETVRYRGGTMAPWKVRCKKHGVWLDKTLYIEDKQEDGSWKAR
jgi:hypothetical protein